MTQLSTECSEKRKREMKMNDLNPADHEEGDFPCKL